MYSVLYFWLIKLTSAFKKKKINFRVPQACVYSGKYFWGDASMHLSSWSNLAILNYFLWGKKKKNISSLPPHQFSQRNNYRWISEVRLKEMSLSSNADLDSFRHRFSNRAALSIKTELCSLHCVGVHFHHMGSYFT